MTQTPEDLARKIRDAREKQALDETGGKPAVSGKDTRAASQAMRAATDLVAALCVGGLLGYGIDKWLGTTPFGMIIFFFLGFAAGFLSIYKSQMGHGYRIGFNKPEQGKKE